MSGCTRNLYFLQFGFKLFGLFKIMMRAEIFTDKVIFLKAFFMFSEN